MPKLLKYKALHQISRIGTIPLLTDTGKFVNSNYVYFHFPTHTPH